MGEATGNGTATSATAQHDSFEETGGEGNGD